VYAVPGLDRVDLLLRAGIDVPLVGGLGFAQLPKKCREAGRKVVNILFAAVEASSVLS